MTAFNGLGQRLGIAVEQGLEVHGDTLVLHPEPDADLSALDEPRVVHPLRHVVDTFINRGVPSGPEAEGTYDCIVVSLPRAKAEAHALIADAAERSRALVIVDGQKNDGVDSILKAVKARVPIGGTISKAHGKLFWFAATDAFADWAQGPALTEGGFWTAPGVFSADAVDEGSALLAGVLPDLKGNVADLGAGWGYLGAHVLAHDAVETAYLVEAHHMALQCAEHNITDPRARFFWADVRNWEAPAVMQAVVMNPPFHDGKQADPGLGAAFIATAARMLAPKGRLFMVANRHLPYEESIDAAFRKTIDLGGNRRFKLLCAEVPRRR